MCLLLWHFIFIINLIVHCTQTITHPLITLFPTLLIYCMFLDLPPTLYSTIHMYKFMHISQPTQFLFWIKFHNKDNIRVKLWLLEQHTKLFSKKLPESIVFAEAVSFCLDNSFACQFVRQFLGFSLNLSLSLSLYFYLLVR